MGDLFLLIGGRWREYWIDYQSESVVDHGGNQTGEERTFGGLEARVRVNLNQVHFEVVIEHEVEAKYFESVDASFHVYFAEDGSKAIS